MLLAGCTGLINTEHRVVGTLEIGADLPLSGDDAPDGLPVKNAVELAVKQAGQVCGAASHPDACVTLQAVIDDDVNKGIHDPSRGATNVQRLAADTRIVGMVGPLYDSLARSEIPIANGARLAMISPANTDECLTQEPPDGHCHGLAARLRPHGSNTYFRVVTTQIVEGAAGAELAAGPLSKRRAFVLTEATPVGRALASEFSARFHHNGRIVLDAGELGTFDPSQAPNFGPPVTRAKTLGADVVYFAGSDLLAAASLRREMAAQVPQVPLIGSDRLGNNQFAKSAGATAPGSYYLAVGVDPAQLGRAATFLRDYRKAYAAEPTGLSLQAFEASNVLVRAIARAIDDANGRVPSREQVLTEVAHTKDLDGLMGRMGFDGRGDTTLKLLTAYQWLAPTERSGRFAATIDVR